MSSCHHIEGRSQDHTVMAGYDDDEQTYFIRVFPKDIPDDQPEQPTFEAGCARRPINFEQLEELLRTHANRFHINDELLDNLGSDGS